jgi:hypothetical protein
LCDIAMTRDKTAYTLLCNNGKISGPLHRKYAKLAQQSQ